MCLQVSRVQCHQAVVLWCLNYSNFVCLSLVMYSVLQERILPIRQCNNVSVVKEK